MIFSIDLSTKHQIVAANLHFYEKPTEPLYLNRTLQYHDLVYLVDGKWTITENEVDYPLEKDDVLLLSAGYHHYTRLPCAPNTRTICIHVTKEAGDNTSNKGALMLPSCMHIHGTTAVRHCFENIVSTFWSDKTLKSERLSMLFEMLMLQLYDLNDSSSKQVSALVQDIDQMFTKNPHVRYRCIDVAKQFSVSTKTIEAAMIRATGMSFTKYQNSRKLEMVVSQMQVEPDLRLAELASLFGFCDEFHLSRVFKQTYGMSPSVYAKTVLTDK